MKDYSLTGSRVINLSEINTVEELVADWIGNFCGKIDNGDKLEKFIAANVSSNILLSDCFMKDWTSD